MAGMKVGINLRLTNLDRLTKTMDSLIQRLSTGKKINSPEDDPSAWVRASSSHSAYDRLQSVNSSLNMVAMNIRIADQTMDTIAEYLDQMQGQLALMVNNYPPSPEGSPERAELIKSYNACLEQINQLTMPSDHEGARKIMSDPSVVPDAGDWEVIVGENNVQNTIHSREVHTGLTGLNIPELAETATDAKIEAAMANLRTAKNTLEQRHGGLAGDAAAIGRWKEHNIRMANIYINRFEEIENADMYEVTAQIKSVELKHSLTIEMMRSITEAQSQLLGLLR